jgi:hypothetical protein
MKMFMGCGSVAAALVVAAWLLAACCPLPWTGGASAAWLARAVSVVVRSDSAMRLATVHFRSQLLRSNSGSRELG